LTAKIPFLPVRDKDGHINSASSITLAGHSITIMHWGLLEPGIELKCVEWCGDGHLIHWCCNFGKNKMLTPVFEIDSKINWTATRIYKCDHCESKVAANDPHLIASLPMHMQQQSPCAANWV